MRGYGCESGQIVGLSFLVAGPLFLVGCFWVLVPKLQNGRKNMSTTLPCSGTLIAYLSLVTLMSNENPNALYPKTVLMRLLTGDFGRMIFIGVAHSHTQDMPSACRLADVIRSQSTLPRSPLRHKGKAASAKGVSGRVEEGQGKDSPVKTGNPKRKP